MFKLLVAISLPEVLKKQIETIGLELAKDKSKDPDTYHVTLAMLGRFNKDNFNQALMQKLEEALSNVELKTPFNLSLKSIGCFENGAKGNYLWVGVEKNDELVALKKSIDTALSREGISFDNKYEYNPHITIARPKDAGSPEIKSLLQKYNSFSPPPFEVKEFSIIKSAVSHEKIKTYKLA